ncbi:mitochondrial ribosomal subunit protein-domain-containing protein [Kickxella alabastrina]|uniref:mitochondrial ribosomal subunit protein-domain-containing protein n=1 Tax=Kickxella alabastrina TaxID=61397 RepID=UPI00221E8DFB|nr:mitochondrial ribosomal subunit protein-domain-containing protein [Kickxella alabastrina]KAI7830042.1 mitochondrial ribosomal subunit protein-domain-containing protein [Kickxella alabastrina]
MSSVLARSLRLTQQQQQQVTQGYRALHASSVSLTGRNKKKVNFKAHAIKNRKEHAEIYDEQDRAYDMEHMEDWEYDDHHTYGHLFLESIRDVRKYVRMMKFEHPTLAQHAKAFKPPQADTHFLKFESSVLAQDRKVVLRLQVAKLGLKGAELHKFLLLVGVRYNPQTDELKMSENREATSLLNKKKLADTLVELIAEAKKKDDMFADVPLDFAYHGYKHKMPFPTEWLSKAKASTE